MTELADQELSGRQPSLVVKDTEEFQDFGYYRDARGYIRKGVIPKKEQVLININREYDDPYRIETSDPRLYTRII